MNSKITSQLIPNFRIIFRSFACKKKINKTQFVKEEAYLKPPELIHIYSSTDRKCGCIIPKVEEKLCCKEDIKCPVANCGKKPKPSLKSS